jgi:aminomethyltransferase
MKQTALSAVHARLSPRMAEFQGWNLPAQFSDPSDEHHAVRTAAGLFDVGFLGRIELEGPGAERLLQSLFTRNIGAIAESEGVFGLFCTDNGSIIDTSLVFRMSAGRNAVKFLVTTNPIATDKVLDALTQRKSADVQIVDRTAETGQLALQGPRAEAVLHALVGKTFKKIKDKRIRQLKIADTAVMVSRTGYTGERGFELFAPADRMTVLWDAILAVGKEYGVAVCGMTCRDILRLEAGYVQNGLDLDGMRTPVEALLMPVVDFTVDFAGKAALMTRKAEGAKEQLVGFEMLDKGLPRPGGTIFSESREIGSATSGNHSPHRRKDIGLGYVATRYAQAGQEIEVESKDREIAARIVALPFYKRK